MLAIPQQEERAKRLLVVEDNALERMLVRYRLREEQMEFIETDSGTEALRLASELRPDIVLLDLHLPDAHGFDVIRELKEEPSTRSIPIIVLSGAAAPENKARALDLGAVDFVTKPFDAIELRARLRSALRTKRLTDMLEQKAHLDPLTGLANRHALFERFEAECAGLDRRGTSLSVVLADLDHFKLINDKHGHSAGDAILQAAARVFREVARRGDLVARYGGEEFVILAPNCDLSGGIGLAARLREAVAAMKVNYGSIPLSVTTSVGAVTINDPSAPMLTAEDASSVFKKVDQALYSAKNSGRNRVHVWSDRAAGPVLLDSMRIPA